MTEQEPNNIKNLMKYYEDNPNTSNLDWIKLLDKTVRTLNDDNNNNDNNNNDNNNNDNNEEELGKVEAVNEEHVVVKKGLINVQRYYIPHSYVKGTDGNEILLKLTRSETEPFIRNNKIPNPANYTTYGGSISHRAYPPIPYMPSDMLRNDNNVRNRRE